MQLSFILSSLQLSGGVNAVVAYANRLSRRGHMVSLVTPAGTIDPLVEQEINPDLALVESGVGLPSARSVVHLFRLTLSLAKATPPGEVIVATHTPTVAPALLASRMGRKGRVLWLYMDYEEMFENRPAEAFLLRRAPRWVDRVAVLSEAGRQEVWRHAQVEATVVGLGLNHPELLLDNPRQLASEIKQVLYVGDMRPRKGLRDFLAAAEIVYEKLPMLRLALVSKQACDIQTPVPFDFYHYPSRETLGKLYRSSHLFVSTSWAEGFGYPPLEAMACGTPVVLTNSRGVLDFARPNENCLMVPPRDPTVIAENMLRLLTDDQLAAQLSKNGPETARRFGWEAAVDRFEALLEEMVSHS